MNAATVCASTVCYPATIAGVLLGFVGGFLTTSYIKGIKITFDYSPPSSDSDETEMVEGEVVEPEEGSSSQSTRSGWGWGYRTKSE